MRIKGFFAVPLSAALLIFGGCAQQAALTGGPRDSTPPRMLRSLPDAEAVGVTSPVIRLTFDEYFTLNSPRDSIRITPAQKNPPDFVQKGKSLVITLKDSLIPNTTYHIDFANGVIRDLTENNPMSASSLVFSTGNAVDSFSLHGVALDA
ncbi:MAG: Ig-like domain-containing protein, partial [Bacteroidales bacterium]|nr:Ig-like domain-containing protein [Bacteroidales bacterium]